jgi:hypothetical protein
LSVGKSEIHALKVWCSAGLGQGVPTVPAAAVGDNFMIALSDYVIAGKKSVFFWY